MKKLTLSLVPLLLILFMLPAIPAKSQATTTFILVRHAETVDDGTKDPALSKKGRQRAEALAELLQKTGVTAVYSTPYRRTRKTAAPLARQKDLEVKEYEPFGPNTLERILSAEKGGKVLIVGHSNTTPLFVNRLIGEELFAQLDEAEYDNLYVVTVAGSGLGESTVLHLTY